MAYNSKAKERTIKYMQESRDKLTINLPRGDKERYRDFAATQGKSLTALIVELLEREIKQQQ